MKPMPDEELSADRGPQRGKGTGLVYGDICMEHEVTGDHLEVPGRLTAVIERLKQRRLYDRLVLIEPQDAPVEWLTEIHDPRYVRRVQSAWRRGDRQLDCPDVPISARSYAAAVAAASGVMAAVDAVMAGKAANAFCAIRPPGHHAMKDRAMGFCIFNNVAVAARYVRKKNKLSRVLIVDWDVHHGNGTQAAFYDDPTVLYFSAHRSPFYPGTGGESETGTGRGEGFTVNVEMPSGAADAEYIKVFRERLAPAADAFKPEFVLVSAGFDAHESDPLGGMKVTSEGYAELTRLVKAVAARHADSRLVTALEGGYDLAGLAAAAEAHVSALME
jgi:acetoin utilization deacetylase AcuC-like enzyme